jgi:hypothetical protein
MPFASEVDLRLLLMTLRVTSIAGMILAVAVFVTVAFFARLEETLTAAILFACLLEVIRDYLTLRYIKRSRMEMKRMELEMYRPTQWYSDRR